MGPNDIYARFSEKLNKDSGSNLKHKDKNKLAVGSSYYELPANTLILELQMA